VPFCNSITPPPIVRELFKVKPSKNAACLRACNEKKILDMGLVFFVGSIRSGVCFWPFWFRLPGPRPMEVFRSSFNWKLG